VWLRHAYGFRMCGFFPCGKNACGMTVLVRFLSFSLLTIATFYITINIILQYYTYNIIILIFIINVLMPFLRVTKYEIHNQIVAPTATLHSANAPFVGDDYWQLVTDNWQLIIIAPRF